MRGRSGSSASVRLPAQSRAKSQPWRAAISAIRKEASSPRSAQIQARVESVRAEHMRRYMRAGGPRSV